MRLRRKPEDGNAMNTFTLDMRPILRIADLVRERGQSVGFVDERSRPTPDPGKGPRKLFRWAWVLDINGLELGFETIDYALVLPEGEDGVRMRQNRINERVYELSGNGWLLRFLFIQSSIQHDAVFRGGLGYVLDPVLIGDRDSFATDLTVARLALSLDRITNSNRVVNNEEFREIALPMPVEHVIEDIAA